MVSWPPLQPIERVSMVLELLCITDLTLSKRRLNEGIHKNPVQIRHLHITINKQLCMLNYDITVALGCNAFSETTAYSASTALGLEWILANTRK